MKEKSKKLAFDYPLYDKIGDESDITAVYLRVSTDTQAQEGYGLDVQYGAIKRYIEAYDVKNAYIFIDDGYTGMNECRPAFSRMQELMNEGRVKLVITYSLDRIGRTQMIILRFLKENCEKAKCDFYAVKDNVDSRSRQTYGILISILSIFAEFDHDAIISKLTSGRVQRAREGLWKGGGIPPYGYEYSKKDGELKVIEEEAEKVGKTLEFAVRYSIEHNWRGFFAKWYLKEEAKSGGESISNVGTLPDQSRNPFYFPDGGRPNRKTTEVPRDYDATAEASDLVGRMLG